MRSGVMMSRAMVHGRERITCDSVPLPAVEPGNVLVKVTVVGICGSDIIKYRQGTGRAVVLGHEIAGLVASPRENFRLGERVAVYAVMGCGHCEYCAAGTPVMCSAKRALGSDVDGGFQEYVSVPECLVYRLPRDIDDELGSLVFDVIGTPCEAIRRVSSLANRSVAIFGLGPIGLSSAILCHDRGAKVVGFDRNEYRVRLARRLEVGEAFVAGFPEAAETLQPSFDVCIDCTATRSTLLQTCRMLCPGGTLILLGQTTSTELTFDQNVQRKGLTIIGSWYSSSRCFDEYIHLLGEYRDKYNTIVTHRVSLDRISEGFHLWSDTRECGKVLVTMNAKKPGPGDAIQ